MPPETPWTRRGSGRVCWPCVLLVLGLSVISGSLGVILYWLLG